MPKEASSATESAAIALMKQRLSGFETEEGRRIGLSYQPGPRDIVITTTPKAGTTWTQQICHQLRTRGDMDFVEISEVVPWLELAHDQGQNLSDPQWGDSDKHLRFFKSHAWAGHCPEFPKTIVVLRDPCDVLVSFWRFFEGWFFEPGTISLEAFAEEFWLARGVPENEMQNASYFVHLISWYQKRGDTSKILLTTFEDLKEDLAGEVKRIAQFVSSDQMRYDSPERIQTAVEKSSYAFMKDNAGQFDEKLSKLKRNEACGLPPNAGMQQ